MNYDIIKDSGELKNFIDTLPDLEDHEVFYFCLFARQKYCKAFKGDGQLSRFTATKEDIVEKISRLESPRGSFIRDGEPVPQEALALYMTINPRSIIKANKNLLINLAARACDNDMNFNPVSLSLSAIHNAISRKFYIDFDYDSRDIETLKAINKILVKDSFRFLQTNGGYHVLVKLDVNQPVKDWYLKLTKLPNCDVKGANNLTPVPGCTQGNFCPYFIKIHEQL